MERDDARGRRDAGEIARENSRTFEALVRDGGIAARRGTIFDLEPAALPAETLLDRVEGMMIGLAIGDSLGNSTESRSPADRRARYGEVRDYLPGYDGRAVGYPSDDTQLAYWTLEQMLEDGGFVPERVAHHFGSGRILGIGQTVTAFLRNRERGLPWQECGVASAGNGALMRIAAMAVPHAARPSSGLWVDTALSAMLTHNDSAAVSSAVAFVAMLWELMGMGGAESEDGERTAVRAPDARWWAERYVAVAREVETDARYEPRSPHVGRFSGTLSEFVELHVPRALDEGRSSLEACEWWYSGAYLLETVPSALHILALHGSDPEEAIVRAVNDTRDNDTIAAIVGAAVGALHGRSALPARWQEGLTGRTREDDDWKVWELLGRARDRWLSPGRREAW